MFKKFGIGALAALMALGALSVVEAANSNDSQNTFCCRGDYCYNQSSQNNKSNRSGNYCGDYCCDGSRGCW